MGGRLPADVLTRYTVPRAQELPMPSPFPGMDPYIESQQRFHTFHTAFIAACSDVINDHLPPPYFAAVDDRVPVDASGSEPPPIRPVRHALGPDVAVFARPVAPPLRSAGRPVATLDAHTLPQAIVSIDQPTQKLIQIYGSPDERLVTTVELLSPSNKRPGPDRDAFLLKRVDLLRHGVNLVDIDLLLAGRRIPLEAALPPGHFFGMVTRADRAEQCDVYGWTIRDALPTLPIPLGEGVADSPLDLAAAFAAVYRRSNYDRMLYYRGPLAGPLSDDDRAWAAERAATRARQAQLRGRHHRPRPHPRADHVQHPLPLGTGQRQPRGSHPLLAKPALLHGELDVLDELGAHV